MSNISNFINTYWPYTAISEKYGVPRLFALAQAALETGYGAKVKGNNLFNIKPGSNWTGAKQLFTTTEYHDTAAIKYPLVIKIEKQADGTFRYTVKDYFRAYNNPSESFEDHAKLLKNLSRYKKAFDYTNNPEQFALEIAKGGYATHPNYANSMIYVIKQISETLKKKAA